VLDRIQRKLEQVRASGKTCFGSETHGFVLGPPIEVDAKLPDEFRRFVTELGGSGAGPFYGLLPRERWKEGQRRRLGFRALTLTDHASTLSEGELATLLDGPAWETAMTQLRERRDGTATARIAQWIDHPAFEQRRAALVCLRLRRDASVGAAMRARLLIEPEPRLRAEIIEGLGAMGDIEPALAAAQGGDALMKFRAAYVLGGSGDARARPVLEKLLDDQRTPSGSAWSIAEQARRALERLRA